MPSVMPFRRIPLARPPLDASSRANSVPASHRRNVSMRSMLSSMSKSRGLVQDMCELEQDGHALRMPIALRMRGLKEERGYITRGIGSLLHGGQPVMLHSHGLFVAPGLLVTQAACFERGMSGKIVAVRDNSAAATASQGGSGSIEAMRSSRMLGGSEALLMQVCG